MAAFHLSCAQKSSNKYDAVISLMSGTTWTFYGGRDEKKENKYVMTSVMEIHGK